MIGALSADSLRRADELTVTACAIAGDDRAYGELVRRRQNRIRQLLRRLCRDHALADDLAQQVFLQAWRSIGSLKSPAACGGWLRRIAINVWLQRVRADRGQPAASLEDLPEPQAGTDTHEDPQVSELLDLDSALATLASDVRLCITLAYAERMSHREICEVTHLPLGTENSHISRGAARLRQLLGAYA